MKKKIGNNLSLKILSLAIAILVWLLVVNINNPISTKSFIVSDVELLNEAYIDADGKMCMQDEEQVPIRVTIKAQRKILDRISLNDIECFESICNCKIMESSVECQNQCRVFRYSGSRISGGEYYDNTECDQYCRK